MHTLFSRFVPFFEKIARLCDVKALDAAAARIHDKYVSSERVPLDGLAEHVAYALCRLPATFAATTQAISHMKKIISSFEPKTALDIGSGPGSAAIASAIAFPSLTSISGYERSEDFIALSKTLFSSVTGVTTTFSPFHKELSKVSSIGRHFDFITASYVFGELPESVQEAWIGAMAENAGVVLLVEPGTPAGWSTLMRCRDHILEKGGEILAPCPHAKPCPFIGTDAWCHEAVRLPRSSIHRRLKQGELGYEDEKFCYLAVSFDKALPKAVPPGRIVHAPKHRHGHTIVTLCTFRGVLEPTTISKKYKELYRLVRESRWGDMLPYMKEDAQ